MEKSPRVGIVIPTYNYSHFLDVSVRSILGQTYDNIIVCIIDDGSTDDTWQKLCEMLEADSDASEVEGTIEKVKFICIRLGKNTGPGHARNVGIQRIIDSVDCILFHDSDDIMLTHKVSTMVEKLYSHEAVGAVYADFIEYHEPDGCYINMYSEPFNVLNFSVRCIVNNDSMVKTHVLEDIKSADGKYYDESLTTAEDYDLWWRVAKKSVILHIPEPLTILIKHPRNSDNRYTKQQMFDNVMSVKSRIIEDIIGNAKTYK